MYQCKCGYHTCKKFYKTERARSRHLAGVGSGIKKSQDKTSKKNKRKSAARKTIRRIETKGSSEDFTVKEKVFEKLTKKRGKTFQCKCCHDYFTSHFLDIDHVKGRKKISKIPALVKIDYNEGRSAKTLSIWLLKHIKNPIIPRHFQILCHNCNRAKFLYLTCPHERKGKKKK